MVAAFECRIAEDPVSGAFFEIAALPQRRFEAGYDVRYREVLDRAQDHMRSEIPGALPAVRPVGSSAEREAHAFDVDPAKRDRKSSRPS